MAISWVELGILIVSLFLVLVFPGALALEEKMGLELKWTFNTSAHYPDKSFGAGHQGCFTVWDVDGDGSKEVLFGTRRGHSKRIWCLSSLGTFEWIYPPIDEDGLPGDPTGKISIVDVDLDGKYELCFGGRGGFLHIVNGDGSVKWIWKEPTSQTMHGASQALDVDGDGYVEFFLNTNDGHIHRVDIDPEHGPTLTWTSAQSGKGNQGHPVVCDIDQDGAYDVLWGSQDFNVYCISADTGKEKWRFDSGANIKAGSPIVSDLDGDGEYEALFWNDAPASAVICISPWGTELWRWTHPREGVNIRICQAVGDVDDDGIMEMAVMSGDRAFVIELRGPEPKTEWEANFTDWSATGKLPEGAQANHWTSYQLIADIDGDDQQEVLWLSPWFIVTDGATGELEGYYVNEHMARNRRQENGAWWGDVDDDGISEWIAEINGNSHPQTQVYCLTMNGKFPANAWWPEYFHAAYPAEYQAEQEWLKSKAAYSNSMFFPIAEVTCLWLLVAMVTCYGLSRYQPSSLKDHF